MTPSRADAFLFDIVLDPVALVEHVLQAAQVAEQIAATVQQVENQVKELSHLDTSVAPNVSATVTGIAAQLDPNLYNTATPANQLNTRFPADMSTATWAQYQSDQSTWSQNQRQALIENRQLENQVYRDMDSGTQKMQSIVTASNGASGQTAALQARNDLLALASGELAKLQALTLTRSRLRAEKRAEHQSEASYAQAERSRVRADWDNPPPPTQTLVDPFQN